MMNEEVKREMPVLIIVLFALVQIGVGAWVGYVTKQNIEYQRCTYNYDKQFSQAYQGLTTANLNLQQALYSWINTIPPLFEPHPADHQVQISRDKLSEYIDAYNLWLKARTSTNFPEPPQTFCGLPPEQ